MNDDLQHLRLLSIFYYIVGGLATLVACIPFIHVGLGIAMVAGLFEHAATKGEPPPAWLGWIFIAGGSLFILLGWSFAIALLVTGRRLQQKRHYLFCLIMAGLACLCQPMGMVLGAFTIIVLIRPSVKELFARSVDTPVSQVPSTGGPNM